MGLNTNQIDENFAGLKKIRIQITDVDSVKPYANLEFRLFTPPTMALKEIVDPSYPARLLASDKQLVKNLSGMYSLK